MRRLLVLVLVIQPLLTVGCTGAADLLRDTTDQSDGEPSFDERLEAVGSEAEDWIDLREFDGEGDDASLAIVSFPDGPDQLAQRTFVYDQALAILWYSWIGDDETAGRLAATLAEMQLEDGSWGFSFRARSGGFYDEGYVRTGAVAWAGWALAYHGHRAGDETALEAAQRAVDFVESRRLQEAHERVRQLYGAGSGYHDPETGERTLGEEVQFVATEHQLDVHKLLGVFDKPEADRLEHRMMEVLWIGDEGRFAMGANAREIDERRALDASGGWGALWLWSVGRSELAGESLDYTLANFGADGADVDGGYVPYLDEVDNVGAGDDLIFVEGSLGVGLAALRLGRPEVTREILEMAAGLADEGGGIRYANRAEGHFEEVPAAASTLWLLFVQREMAGDRQAPLFLPSSSMDVAPLNGGEP